MTALYGFGHSQEDERTEAKALGLPGGRVLCITSAGEMPLGLLALGADEVVGIDIDPNQSHLARLKLAAVLHLERAETIAFLGYRPMRPAERIACLDRLLPELPAATRAFWLENHEAVAAGPIWAGKFESFLRKALRWTGPVVSRPFRKLTACATLEEQREVFQQAFDTALIHTLFGIVFHPRIYGGRGLDERALQHLDDQVPLGERFFGDLRSLCEQTLARDNHLLQLFTLGEVRSDDVVPSYLTAVGYEVVRARHEHLQLIVGDVGEFLADSEPGRFDGFHLSNVTDWMPHPDFERLMRLLLDKAKRPARFVWRHIHQPAALADELAAALHLDPEWGRELRGEDRFPFYTVLPGRIE